ncbi:nuclear pore complex NUP107 isoform B [Micractinium conductrix]|uniref:Nuclear pore complex protein n=1 Tax=Micractinium conductrix TaxID=554055 RepID=A0A2P6VQV4_9CHLO|nr:nuclear pore complex NUP107 isoform B [Micractinium conductrix]|eukprot:PSC76457.1 nuclear pore complex NUP107 isoform B [Micractinium conductrix]
MNDLPFGNPLFGRSLMSPGSGDGPSLNPVFSPATAGGGAPTAPPSSAVGLLRLGFMPRPALQPSPGSPDDPMEAMEAEGSGLPPGGSLAVAGASPGGGAALAGFGGRERPEEDEFATVLSAVMRGEAGAAEAVREYAAVCRQRAAALKELASSQLQRAARHMALREQAEELEGEAATWQLLWFLHGRAGRDFPAGSGGAFVDGAGFSKTVRQRAADLLFADAALNRCARTVAWLEYVAGEALDGEHAAPLASSDGVWADTRRRLDAAAAARGFAGRDAVALVTELDPDAPSRQHKALHADDAKDEERLAARLFRLLRAGRVAEACQLCEAVGQPWRAASLGGGGVHGALPLGAAAEAADGLDPAGEQAQDLAAEVEGGGALLRALWRWSCLQLAERAGAAAEASGAGLHEAAVYAALGCHVARVLPVCTSWEDACWAYLRCWLDAAVDGALLEQQAAEGEGGPGDGLLAGDALASAAGGAGGAGAGVVQEGLAVARGSWPVSRVRDALPPTFEEALQAAISSRAAATGGGGGGAASRYRRVQAALVLGQVQDLVCRSLVGWITQGTGDGAGADGAPACPPGLMRFAAHLALALWALDIAVTEGDGAAGTAYAQLHDTLQRVLQVYCFHLIDTGAHRLVPLYACHLRAGLRHTTYQIFFEQQLAQGTMEDCRAAYQAAAEWFGFWRGRGDVGDGEAALIAEKAAQHSRFEVGGGPLLRAQSARWLCFEAATAAAALRHANQLCREFALGGVGGVAAATALLSEVMPAALDAPLERFIAGLEGQGEATLAGEAAELRCWAVYFEYESEFGGWQQLYSAAVEELQAAEEAAAAGGGGAPQAAAAVRQQLRELAGQTLPLLQAMLDFLAQRSLDALVGAGAAAAAALPGEVAVVVGPDSGLEAAAESLQGAAFAAFGSPEEQQAEAEALQGALAAAAAGLPEGAQRQLAAAAGPAPDDMPGLVTVALECGTPEALEAAALLLSRALKGSLPAAGRGAAAPGPLLCAALREALAFMGHCGPEGSELAVVAASDDLSVLFSPAELAELLQFERAATVLQMRNREQQQQKGADGEEQQRGEEVDVERGRRQQQQQARAGGGDAQQGILAEDGPL